MSNSLDLQQTTNGNVDLIGGAGGGLEDLQPFFGGDVKGLLYVEANYSGSDYRTGVASRIPTRLYLQPLLEAIMTGKVKNNPVINTSYIQPDFISLIISTARAHRNLDTSSGRGDVLNKFVNLYLSDNFNRNILAILNAPDVSTGLPYTDPFDEKWIISLKEAERLYNNGATDLDINILQVYQKLKNDIQSDYSIEVLREKITNILYNNDINTINYRSIARTIVDNLLPQGAYSPINMEFYQKVYSRWDELNSDVRHFYEQNITVLEQQSTGGWRPFSDYKNIDRTRPEKYRFNLNKENGRTVFSIALPHINATRYTHLIFPPNVAFAITPADNNILSQLYDKVYNNEAFTIGIVPIDLSTVPLIAADYDFNWSELAALLNKGVETLEIVPPPPPVQLDQLFRTAQSEGEWKSYGPDRNYHVKPDGTYAQIPPHCAPDDKPCLMFFRCILDDNYKSIGRCVKDLTNANVLQHVENLINNKNLNPADLKKILKKFDVRYVNKKLPQYDRSINVPQTYDHWLSTNRLPQEIKNTITPNPPRTQPSVLENVIRATIEYLTAHPEFINTGLPVARPVLPAVGTKYIPSAVAPPINQQPKIENVANILNQPLVALAPYPYQIPLMAGGGIFDDALNRFANEIKSCAAAYRNLFEALYAEMKASGKMLRQEDQDAITKLIEEYENKEKTLKEVYQHLRAYVLLLRAFRYTPEEIQQGDNVGLTNIANRAEMNRLFAEKKAKVDAQRRLVMNDMERVRATLQGAAGGLVGVLAGGRSDLVVPV